MLITHIYVNYLSYIILQTPMGVSPTTLFLSDYHLFHSVPHFPIFAYFHHVVRLQSEGHVDKMAASMHTGFRVGREAVYHQIPGEGSLR